MATTTKSTEDNSTPKQAANTEKKVTPAATKSKSTTKKTVASDEPKVIPGISQEVINVLNEEINLMLAFAANNGLNIDTTVNNLIQSDSVDDLINAHNLLCKNVAPATPKSIGYTNRVRMNNRKKSVFRQIPLVRNLIILAILFLIGFVGFGYSDEVNNDSLDAGLLANHGESLLLNVGFLSSIAGLGVLFHLLKSVGTAVMKSTLVPEETINYVSQILLGVIAGLILSEIIVVYSTDPKDINLFNKSVLALIGGFSSDAIFTILEGLIMRLKNIFIPAKTQ
jgi:hypothetical protein